MAPQSNTETFEKIDIFRQPVISDRLAIVYRILALILLFTIGYSILEAYQSGELMTLMEEEWHWLMYLVLVPFFFFAKELHNKSALYIRIDCNRKELTLKKSSTQKDHIPFDSIKDIAFKTNRIIIKLTDGTQQVFSTSDLLYRDVQKLKSLLHQIVRSTPESDISDIQHATTNTK